MTTTKPHRATELACEDTIVRAAKLGGWRVHAERASRTASGRHATAIKGHKGWPDLVLAREGIVIVAELKRKPNKVEDDQRAWLSQLNAAVPTFVWWVPEQLDMVTAALAAGRVPEFGRWNYRAVAT